MQDLSQRQSPALLWYSAPGERIELSGRVLDNWVAKTANLLVDECELEAGQVVCLPQQLHWRSVIIALAALRLGAEITFEQGQESQVCATFDPAECRNASSEHLLVLATEPLALRFSGDLPAGALDYAAEVRSHPDIYMGFSEPSSQDNAWETTSYGELMQGVDTLAQSLRSTVEASFTALEIPDSGLGTGYLRQALAVLSAGYALLILDPSVDWEKERISRVLADERAQLYPGQ